MDILPAAQPGKADSISEQGIRLIKAFESCELKAYPDAVGVWTIGWGHTEGVKPGQCITQAQADTFFNQDIRQFEQGVLKRVNVPVSQSQFDALVSLSFNIGLGALGTSTLLRKLNAGDDRGAADEFMRWVYAKGKRLAGLERRRKAEKALFEQ